MCPWRGAIWFPIIGLIVTQTPLAEAQDLSGFVRSTTTLTESEVEDTSTELQSYNQIIDLNWNRRVSSLFRYRVSLRAEDSRDRTEVDSDVTKTSSTSLEPILDMTLTGAIYSLNAGIRLREEISDGNEVERVRTSDRRAFTRLFLTPPDLPSLSFLFDRLTSEDDLDPKVEDTVDTRYEVSTEYAFETVSLFYTFDDRVFEDNAAGFTRDTMNHVGTVSYSDSFFQDRLEVTADYTGDYTKITEEFFRDTTVDVERRLSRGLRAGPDPTPGDSSDVLLTDESGLLTGAANVPLDLNIAIGFELSIREQVSEIRISLAPEPPFTLPDNLELFLSFRVFFTDDTNLETWTEIAPVSQTFDQQESRFTLTFAATTARFFKAFVDRNDFGALVRATQIAALDLETVSAGEDRERSTLIQRFGAGLAYTPVDWVTGSLDLSLTDTTQDPDNIRTTDGTVTARLVAELHRLLIGTFTYQHGFDTSNQPGSEDTTDDTYSLLFTSRPLPTLTSSLTLVHREDRTEGNLDERRDTASLNTSAEVYRNLNLTTTYSISQTEDFDEDRESLDQTGSLNASAILTEKLSSTLGYTFRWTDAESPTGDETTTSHTANASFTYTLSRLANFNARFDFSETGDTTTFTQLYTMDWIPASKLSFFTSYRRVNQELEEDSTGSDSVIVNSRWNISTNLNVDGNFIYFRSFEGDTSGSITGSVQLRF